MLLFPVCSWLGSMARNDEAIEPMKRLWECSFLEASPHFVEAGLISDAEVHRLSAELAKVAADETVSVAQGRMPVTWARKPPLTPPQLPVVRRAAI